MITALEGWGWRNLHGKSDQQLVAMLQSGERNTQSQSPGTGKAFALLNLGDLDRGEVQASLDDISRSGSRIINTFVNHGALMALVEAPITGELTDPNNIAPIAIAESLEQFEDPNWRARAAIPQPPPPSPFPEGIQKLMVLAGAPVAGDALATAN